MEESMKSPFTQAQSTKRCECHHHYTQFRAIMPEPHGCTIQPMIYKAMWVAECCKCGTMWWNESYYGDYKKLETWPGIDTPKSFLKAES